MTPAERRKTGRGLRAWARRMRGKGDPPAPVPLPALATVWRARADPFIHTPGLDPAPIWLQLVDPVLPWPAAEIGWLPVGWSPAIDHLAPSTPVTLYRWKYHVTVVLPDRTSPQSGALARRPPLSRATLHRQVPGAE